MIGVSWHKGKKLTEEHKRKISIGNKGKKHGPHTEEYKKKLSDINTGRKGYWKGKKHTEEYKKKMSDINKGKKRAPFSEETKKKMSVARLGKKYGPRSEETKKKLSQARNSPKSKQAHSDMLKKLLIDSKKGGTDIEIKLQKIMEDLGYTYDIQHYIVNITTSDGFVKPNYAFFADSCYWHTCREHYPIKENKLLISSLENRRQLAPEKDIKITNQLTDLGYIVLRFWSHDLNKEPEKVKEKIKEILGKPQTF